MNTSALVSVIEEDNFLVLHLGTKEEKAVILTTERMTELEEQIRTISQRKDLSNFSALIFTTPEGTPFCMGANIHEIQSVTDPAIGKQLAARGQKIFDMIENIAIPTIAAIDGPCVGGGCELALACNYRIISSSSKSKIGLPETKLGIIPGFGGTQRLPKLIGLPKALDIILGGKVLPGKKAKRLGLVDAIFEYTSGEKLKQIFTTSNKILSTPNKSKISFVDQLLSSNLLGRTLCRRMATKAAFRKTRGNYPAIPAAIESSCNAYSTHGDYEREATLLGEMIVTPESKSLVHIFFLTEAASKLGKGALADTPLTSVGVIGAGVMGKGIAAVAARKGLEVSVVDPNSETHSALTSHVESFIQKSKSLSEAEKTKLINSVSCSDDLGSLANCEIIIEAAVENLEVKRKIFSELESKSTEKSVLATNTSSLRLSDVFQNMKSSSRCIGVHFFNPVEQMPLIEIIRTQETSDATLLRTSALVQTLSKYGVIVEDVPGFLVNRILAPFLSEASQVLLDGASIQSIESGMKDFGFPMGPFRLLDEVGLDIAQKVQEVLTEAYGERMKGSGYLKKALERGYLGKKGGVGFYNHTGSKAEFNMEFISSLETKSNSISKDECITRCSFAMIAEAIRAYTEGVAGQPGEQAQDQIDLASVMGFGFPPFRGGIFHYLHSLGEDSVVQTFASLKGKSLRFDLEEDKIRQVFRDKEV